MERKILRLLIVAIGLLALLVIALAFLFATTLGNVQRSLHEIGKDADIVSAIHAIKTVNGRDGIDGLSIQGASGASGLDGKDGKDSTSTIVIEQQPVKGDKGDRGDAGAPAAQVEFDGQGHWRYVGDDEWKPLSQQPTPLAAAE